MFKIFEELMPYPEMMIHGMRAELAQLGIEETKTTEAVNEAVKNTDGTLMVVVNSVCGCAAGGVRPGIAMALANSENKPDRAITVFAGADIDATDTARGIFHGLCAVVAVDRTFEERRARKAVRTPRPRGPSAADDRPGACRGF